MLGRIFKFIFLNCIFSSFFPPQTSDSKYQKQAMLLHTFHNICVQCNVYESCIFSDVKLASRERL